MNEYSREDINNLPLSKKEEAHESRERKGRHVFISRFFLEFSALSLEEQNSHLGRFAPGEDISVDSTDTPPEELSYPKVWDVMGIANERWKSLGVVGKTAWDERAAWLNRRPLPGKYSCLPDRFAQPSVENNTIDGIYFDFKQLVREMSVFIIRKPRGGQSQKVVNFGAESVLLGTQKYKRDIYFTYNIRLALFGRGLAQLHDQELISAQKNTTLVHFYSLRRIKEVFTIAGLCCMTHERHSRVHTCCAKVSTRNRATNRTIIGYILDECSTYWQVQLANNTMIQLPRGTCCRVSGKYTFEINDADTHMITQVWPVRMIICASGKAQISLIRFCYFKNNNNIDIDKCS